MVDHRLELQQKILKQYGDRVKEAVERLCKAPCVEWFGCGLEGGNCVKRLLPICSDGSDCTYFSKENKEK